MSGFDIATIIDKKDKTLPKPYINRSGFDMKYAVSYISHYGKTYANKLNQIFDNERLFDTLSTIKQNETLVQWAIRVRISLQDLPRIHKSHMAICFGCWKLIKIDDVQPKKSFHFTRRRYVDRLVPKKEPSNARLAWNSLPNNNTPDDKKFLGLTRCKIKNPQTREQFNQWRTKWIEIYKNDYMMRSSIIIRQYEEYYILVNWISSKKSQLQVRFQKRLLEIGA
ncbi:hypothetical protein C2G38_2156800 [Gigaspora rosea]|uniref:Uncharacterized protein n=1 Tax=Gigaspora rosea TaxID=44941 RepID=A0A397WAU5_9GLOM|nr:hypothetical protein C2G38_2156800 [Gigaspora rosea]